MNYKNIIKPTTVVFATLLSAEIAFSHHHVPHSETEHYYPIQFPQGVDVYGLMQTYSRQIKTSYCEARLVTLEMI